MESQDTSSSSSLGEEENTAYPSSDSLFEKPVQTSQPTVLLVDCSGSVNSSFEEGTVFDWFLHIATNLLDGGTFRAMFWNSDTLFGVGRSVDDNHLEFFKRGVKIIPYVITRENLSQLFGFVLPNITSKCLTFPHLGFEAIPPSWFSNEEITNVVLLTDGQMGFQNTSFRQFETLKKRLAQSISKMMATYPMARLSIISVEVTDTKLDDITSEALQHSAGGDVYKVLQEERLTRHISKFQTHNLRHPDGYVHLEQTIAPPGFLPFRNTFFSPLKIWQFYRHVGYLIQDLVDTQDILKLAQDIVPTLSTHLVNRTAQASEHTIQRFASLFCKSSLDPLLIGFILAEAIDQAQIGAAPLLASYRERNRRLYTEADKILQNDTKNALRIVDRFVSLPVNSFVITGSHRLVDTTWRLKNTYKRCGVKVNPDDDRLLPALPLRFNLDESQMMEQCLRQFVRQILAAQYSVGVTSDAAIYIILGLNFLVSVSDVSANVKQTYRDICTVMWKKQRSGTDQTELANLGAGCLPLSTRAGDNRKEFLANLSLVSSKIIRPTKPIHPLSLWAGLVEAWNPHGGIARCQRLHCLDALDEDFQGRGDGDSVVSLIVPLLGPKPITQWDIPQERALSFTCPITLDECGESGGRIFVAHKSPGDFICHPLSVLSEEGYQEMIKDPQRCMCPMCYKPLTPDDFETIGPKTTVVPPDIWLGETFFADRIEATKTGGINSSSQVGKSAGFRNYNDTSHTTSSSSGSSSRTSSGRPPMQGTIVFMKGTVGSGKTTLALALQKELEGRGRTVFYESVDHYARQDNNIGAAVKKVKESLRGSLWSCTTSDPVFVIIDTCGEKTQVKNVFGVDFTGWTSRHWLANKIDSDIKGYMAWSLRNLLERGEPEPSDHFYLTPAHCDVVKCVSIHTRKCRSVLGRKSAVVLRELRDAMDTQEHILASVSNAADRYAAILPSVDEAVERFAKKVTK